MAKQLNVNLAFNADTGKAKAQLQDLQNSLNQLMLSANKTGPSGLGLTKELVQATNQVAELSAMLESAKTSAGTLDLGKLNLNMKQNNKNISDYAQALSSLGTQGEQAFAKLAQSITTAEIPLRRSSSLLSQFATTLKNTARWQISSSILHGFMGTVQSAYGYAQDLNESLNNIRIVTGQNADQMAKFAKEANNAAKALSSTTTEYTNASLIYYQQGLSDAEVKERTEVTIKMAHASGQSAEIVSDQMTAIWNNFYDGSKSLEHYADVMTALGAATASSSDEIAGGLEKFASIAEMIGLSYEYAASALATITATTRQSEDVVGTALKTIFARIQGLNLGETLDDGTTLNKYSAALEKVGISIYEQNGELKNMDSILNEMGAKWDTLAKDQQVALAQTVAGVRQYNQLVSLMDNWDFFEENLAVAQGSEGTLQEQADIYAESWEAARDRVAAAAQDIYDSILDDKFFIAITNGFGEFLNVLGDTVDTLGGLPGVLSIASALLFKMFGPDMTAAIERWGYNIKLRSKDGLEEIIKLRQRTNAELRSMFADNANDGPINQTKGDVYTRQANLQDTLLVKQQQLVAAGSKLTEEEQKQAGLLLDINNQLGQSAIKAAENLEAQTKTSSQLEQQYQVQLRAAKKKGTLGSEGVNDFTRQLNQAKELQVQYGLLSNISSKLNTGKDFNASVQSLKNLSKTAKDAQIDFSALDQILADVSNGSIKDMEALKNAVQDAMYEVGATATINFDKIRDSAERAGLNMQELGPILTKMEQSFAQTGRLTAEQIQILKDYGLSVDQAAEKIKRMQGVIPTAAQGFVTLGQQISNVAMVATTLKGIFETWNNEDMTVGEKLLSTLTSLGLIIPMITTSLSKNTLTSLAAASAAIAHALGLKVEATAAKVAAGETAKFGAVLTGVLGPIALVVAAIGVLVAIIYKLVTAKDAETKTLEHANELLKESKTAYESASEAARNFKEELSDYESAIEGLSQIEQGSKDLAEAVEEVNEKAKALIQTYKLFDDYYYGEKGEILFNEGVLEGIQKELKLAENLSKINYYGAQIHQERAQIDYDAKSATSGDLGQFTYYRTYETQRGARDYRNSIYLTEEEYKANAEVAKRYAQSRHSTEKPQYSNVEVGVSDITKNDLLAIQEVISSLDEVPASARELVTAIRQMEESAEGSSGLSEKLLVNLDSIITDNTFPVLNDFNTNVNEASESCKYLAQEMAGLMTDDEYAEGIRRASQGDKNLANLMYQAKNALLNNGDADLGALTLEKEQQLQNNVLSKIDDYDNSNIQRGYMQDYVEELLGDQEGFDYNAWMAENYSKIFAGSTTGYSNTTTAQDMGQAWLESQGYSITNVDNKNGKTVYSVMKNGEANDITLDNEMAQDNWAQMVGNFAIGEYISNQATSSLDPQEFESLMSSIIEKGEQFGADWSSSIITGIANNNDFDFSSLFGDITQSEFDYLSETLTGDNIADLFGINWSDIGFASAADFKDAFMEGFEGYSAENAYKVMASELGMTSEALQQYTDELKDNYDLGEDEEAIAQRIAKAQIPVYRNVKKVAEAYQDNKEALDKANEGTEEYATACDTMAVALNKIFGDGVFDATIVADNLETIKKAMEGDIEAYEKLQDLAGEKLLIDAGINIKEGVGQEINDWIGSQEFNDLEIGATLDLTGMTAAFQALLDSGTITVDQMNSILSGIGFEPDIDYVDVPLDQAAYNKDSNTYTVEYLDTEGNVQTKTITADQYNEAEGTGSIQVPIINGKETLKVSSPKAAAKAAKTGSGGGGGGKKSTPAKPVKYTKKSDVVDRYKEQDDALDDIQETLEDINKESERLYGAKRLKQMDKEQKALLAQKKALEDKAKVAKDFYNEDQKRLKDTAAEYGLNFDFDDLGNITNYTTEMTKLYDELHAAEEKMDQMSTKEAQDEFKEATVQPIQDKIEELKKLISQYDETKELLEDLQDEIDEAFYAWQDSNYEELTYKLELKLEVNDAELKKLEYFLDKYSDNFYKMAESAALMNDKIDPTIQNLEDYKSHKEALDDAYRNGEISQEAYIEGLKEVREGYYENLEALIELDKAMMHYYGDTLDAASEELSTFTDHMEHLTSVFDHYMSLMEILGKQKDYDAMGNFLGGKADTIRDRLDVAKEYYEMLKENSKADEYWANYQSALAAGDDDMATWWKEQWDAEINALDEAQAEMLGLTEEWAEAMKAVIENNMNKIAETLEKTLTGGTTFDTMMDEFDKLNTRQEEYLTKTNQIYETNKLMRTANKALDETDNKVAKQKLKNFIDETKSLQENTQLSKYELEIQQAKYDLLLAEIALEEAQNAKSTVRLSRDNEGNFGYIYTADEDAIDNAQQGVEDANNRLYNLSLEGQQEYTEKYLQAQQEMYNELTALQQAWLNGEIASEEEYQRQKDNILNHYLGEGGVLQTYSNLYRIACQTDADAVADNWQTNYGDMTQDTETWKVAVNQYLEDIKVQTDAWKDVSTQANADVEGALEDSEGATKDLKDESSRLADTITSKVIPAIDKELEKVAAQTAAYAAQRKELLALIEQYEAYIESLNKQVEIQSVGFDKDTDYSALMNEYLSKGGSTEDEAFKELQRQREAKIAWLQTDEGGNKGPEYWGTSGQDTIDKYNRILAGEGTDEENAWFNADYVKDEELAGIFEKLGVPLGALEESAAAIKDITTSIDGTTTTVGENTVNKIGETTDGINGKIGETTDSINRKIEETNENLSSKIEDSGEAIINKLGEVEETTAENIGEASEKTISTLTEVHGAIKNNTSTIVSAVGNAASTVASSVGGAISSIRSEISSLRSTVNGMAIGSIAGPVGTAVGGLIGSVISRFDSGGYTGDWGPAGKLAVLDEKELVLNKSDTDNILQAVSIIREISDMIDIQANAASLFTSLSSPNIATSNEVLEQMVTIHAEFPNATNHSEIEEAFNNLVNRASQYANRK